MRECGTWIGTRRDEFERDAPEIVEIGGEILRQANDKIAQAMFSGGEDFWSFGDDGGQKTRTEACCEAGRIERERLFGAVANVDGESHAIEAAIGGDEHQF